MNGLSLPFVICQKAINKLNVIFVPYMKLKNVLSVFLLVFGVNTVRGCGVHIHCYISNFASKFWKDHNAFDDPSLQAGSFFPDWGYNAVAGKSKSAERSHWGPFYAHFIDLFIEKYGNLNCSHPTLSIIQRQCDKKKRTFSFLMGGISHGVADAYWHDILEGHPTHLQQGFMSAVASRNFHRNKYAAHQHMVSSVLDLH